MYYADGPDRPKQRLPMSREIRTLGLVSGIALPFLLVGCAAAPVITPLLLIMPPLLVADLTLLTICMINPATPKRRTACKVVGAVGGLILAALILYSLLVCVGVLPLVSFTNTDPNYIGNIR